MVIYSSEYHYTLKDFIEEINKSELTIITPKVVGVLDFFFDTGILIIRDDKNKKVEVRISRFIYQLLGY